MKRYMAAFSVAVALVASLAGCSSTASTASATSSDAAATKTVATDSASIEESLNLAKMGAEWSLSNDAWTLSPVTAVVNPEIEDQQGVSVCVPAAYVEGVDTDGDGKADATDGTAKGTLVINKDAKVTSTNGQEYTAATAPVILNTGAAGYGSSTNTQAASTYAAEGYINVSCGNRGKQDTATDADGNEYYTGDAPCCLVDQKNAARFVKYNILLGNLPGNVDYFVSTGGSGGGAHAAMFAATSNNPDFYPYEVAAGAVGVYDNGDGTYTTSVTIDGKQVELSDGAWGCVAYSAITSLAEADMALAFEYYLDPNYDFGSDFRAKTAEALAAEYMDYINGQKLTVDESKLGLDVDGDGKTTSNVALTIEHDAEKYPDTNGYGGTYLDLYLAEFQDNLQWYLDNLDYAEDWTWFDAEGKALSDEDVAKMTSEQKAEAFLQGRYAKSSTGMGGPGGGMGGPGGGMGGPGGGAPGDGGPGGNGGAPSGEAPSGGAPNGTPPNGTPPDGGPGANSSGSNSSSEGGAPEGAPNGTPPDGGPGANSSGSNSSSEGGAPEGAPNGTPPDGGPNANSSSDSSTSSNATANSDVAENSKGDSMEVGTPDKGTTQAAGSGVDSSNYESFSAMLDSYKSDIAEIEAGDEYGNNIVELYDPTRYIGAEDTEAPTWTRVVMGASEGDMSMFASLNMQLKWLNSGTDATIEWQWDGGHVPSETLGNSLPLWVDTMYGEYVEGAKKIEKPAAEKQTKNGEDESATGTDITSWVDSSDIKNVSFSLADAAAYRTAGAAKAIPGFDVIDYGQEDYVFGSKTTDARHWSKHVLKVFEDNASTLEPLFNKG